jgi:hypothetical protein
MNTKGATSVTSHNYNNSQERKFSKKNANHTAAKISEESNHDLDIMQQEPSLVDYDSARNVIRMAQTSKPREQRK